MTLTQQQMVSAPDVDATGIFSANVPLLTEFLFGLVFAVCFAFLRMGPSGGFKKASKEKKGGKPVSTAAKLIAERFAANDMEGVLHFWRTKHAGTPAAVDTMKTVARAFVSTEPDALVEGVMHHMKAHARELGNISMANVVLDAIALCDGGVVHMERMWQALQDQFGLKPNTSTKEAMILGHAWAGDEPSAKKIVAELEAQHAKISARSYSCMVRGFLKHGLIDPALQNILKMSSFGYNIHPAAVVDLTRQALASDRARELVERTRGVVSLTTEAVAVLLEECLRRDDFLLAQLVDDIAIETNVTLNTSAYDSLLKIYTDAGDARASTLFDAMQQSGLRISDGLCVSLISRCAVPKFRKFAEQVVQFVRARGKMTLNMYSALMKVYAYECLYEKACRLYDQLLEEGLEPDSMMYGCLLKFALECGRTDLLTKFSAGIVGTEDIQHIMLMIRACGQAKDVDRAFVLFNQVKAAGIKVDVTVFNVLLDACVAAGAIGRARSLVKEMPAGFPDEVTYNVLLKGYCAAGDASEALQVLSEMEEQGCAPSTTAYNCLLNMDISAGKNARAWKTIGVMEERGVPVDKYTVSTMIKCLKWSQSAAQDLRSILILLDRSGLNVCGDDILFNTVLEACCRQRMYQRIRDMLSKFEASGSAKCAAMHTHAVVIKAYSLIQRVDRCWEVWDNLVNQRCLEPSNIVIGCFLDALVCNNCVADASKVFFELKARGTHMNPVMYSTLMKGILNQGSAKSVITMFEEMRADGSKPNVASYNCAIEAYVREGQADKAQELMDTMQSGGCEANDSTHAIILKTHCAKGELDKAWEVFRGISSNGCGYIQVYNTLLDCSIQGQRLDIAKRLVDGMQGYKIKPTSFTMVNHIKYYGRIQCSESAFNVINTWPAMYGFAPNMAAKTCLVRACMHSASTDLGAKVIREIMESDQALDEKSWRSLILSCVQGNLLDQAIAIVEGLYGLEPTNRTASLSRPKAVSGGKVLPEDVIETLLRAVVKQGMREQVAKPLLEKLQARGVKLSPALKVHLKGRVQ